MARNSSDQVLATLRASLDASEARCAGTEFQLSENKRKLQTALNVIKATEADAIQAVATEDAMSRLREEMEVLVRRVQEVEKEKDAVNATNQALVDELMEQLLVSTRRCDEMDEDVKTLQICAAEACQRTQEANLLSAQLSSANAALAELRRRCDDNNAELSNLRQFQAMWDSRKQSLEVELYTHVEASEQTQIKIEALQQELGHKAEDLIVMSSEYKRMCSELSQREADIRAINVDVAALEKKYGEATADLSVAESALGICEAQVEALRAQLLESDQQRQYYESISCDLREENSKMLLMLSNLEAELNSASVYRLEALEREARWQRDEALLLKEKESLQLETSRIIDAMRQQLADNASRLVSVVDRTEAERTISNLQESHIREIDRLMRDLDEQGDRNRRLIEEVVACTDIISMCSKSVTNITSHRDLDQVIRKRINDTIIARSKDDLEQSALAQLHENLSELQRTINVLSDVAEPISRAIADACLYMLRGRRWGRLDGFNNVEIEDSASCRNGSNFVDDQDANESRSLTGRLYMAIRFLFEC